VGTTPVLLRPATAADIPQIIAWEHAPHAIDFVHSWTPERHAAAQADPAETELIVEADGRSVGFVILCGLGMPEVEFCRFAIGEPGRGYGSAAIAQVVASLLARPEVERIWLDVVPSNAGARAVYEAAGFRLDGIRENATEDRAGNPAPLAYYSLRR
jgi:diamine N-acetyltransferase